MKENKYKWSTAPKFNSQVYLFWRKTSGPQHGFLWSPCLSFEQFRHQVVTESENLPPKRSQLRAIICILHCQSIMWHILNLGHFHCSALLTRESSVWGSATHMEEPEQVPDSSGFPGSSSYMTVIWRISYMCVCVYL